MAVLGGLGAATFLLRPPSLDETTLCRTDARLGAHTIVLVDSTDRLEPRHRRKLRAVLMQERARLGQYDRLTIMRLNVRRPQEPAILFSRCLPRPPEQTNPLFEDARNSAGTRISRTRSMRRCDRRNPAGRRALRQSLRGYAPWLPILISAPKSPTAGWC